MTVSQARIDANRANALKSTGPKTAEGKERSRCNAVKHGLTGEGVAISTEEAEAIQARLDGMQADFRPATERGRDLVRRAAMLSVRLERCVIQEAAAISKNVRAAEADFDEARAAEVDALFETLDENPALAVRKLLRMPEGIDRMLETWSDLLDDLTHEGGERWSDDHGVLAIRLTGRHPCEIGVRRVEALALAVVGDFSLLRRGEGEGMNPRDRSEWARSELAELILSESAKLEEHRASLDLEALAADRAGSRSRALFDPGKEATLARKYEAAAERAMHRAIGEMREVEAEAASRPETAPGMASSSPPIAPRAAEPSPGRPTIPGDSLSGSGGRSNLVGGGVGRTSPARN